MGQYRLGDDGAIWLREWWGNVAWGMVEKYGLRDCGAIWLTEFGGNLT